MQLILVVIVIHWPESVTYWLDKNTIDPSKIEINVPQVLFTPAMPKF